MAFAEELYNLPAVRAFNIAEILNHPEHGDVHLLSHHHSLFHNHRDELLRRGHYDEPVEGQGLPYGQVDVRGAGRHIHEHEVDVAP